MFWMGAYTLLGEVGGGWALEFPNFLVPKWNSPIGSFPFHRAQKISGIPGPNPLPLPQVMYMYRMFRGSSFKEF